LSSNVQWVFDPVPPSGRRSGGDPTSYVFSPDIDALVREVVQNANDQRVGDEPVRVTFNLRELSGVQKQTFLDALDWPRLSEHLHGVAKSDSLINGQVRVALDELEGKRDSDSLFILEIQDRGTKGLTGSEDGTGNFGALCKHVLVTNDEKAARGGSYGLGKAVLWRFSSLSTVLFGSTYEEDHGAIATRLFGNTGLPYHEAEGTPWEGPGFFGTKSTVKGGERAESVRGTKYAERAGDLYVSRAPENGLGTTAVVVGFSEPARETRRPLPEIAQEIAEAAATWFWPRLEQGSLKVTANAYSGSDLISSVSASSDMADSSTVLAATLPVTGDRALNPGDVSERELEIRVPRELTDSASGDVEGKVLLRLVRTDDEINKSSVALMRGAGMVVTYYHERRIPMQAGGYRAVLITGTWHGTSENDRKIEEFLRASEPPAHDAWVHHTNALKSRYRRGSQTRLNELWQKIRDALEEMLVVQTGGDEQGPAQLAKYFRLGTQGTSGHEHTFQVDYSHAAFDGDVWRVAGTASRTRGDRTWYVDISAKLEGEGGKYPMTFQSYTADAGTAHLQGAGKLLRIDLASNQRSVTFAFEAAPGADEAALVSESRMRVDARSHQSER
jgi:hypothetical protein